MVADMETRVKSVTEGKVARACDACTRRLRASWYCPADDAFFCQSCDASIHSANQLAKRHERVRLQSPSSSPELDKTADKTTSVWYEGFRRKARTPRNKSLTFLQINSNDPLVPDLGGEEEEEDCFFSFSSTDDKEESLNCCVPVFDPFSSEMVIDDNSFGLVPYGVNITTNRVDLGDIEKAIMDDEDLIGHLPLDMDLGELTMDVGNLLEEDQHFLGVKELNDIGFEIKLKRVKDEEEEEEEAKCENEGSRESDGEESEDDQDKKTTSLFLRLDYEAVISAWDSHGSPWKTGIKPECLLGGNTCPSSVIGGFDGCVTRQQWRGGGGSDGEREAKVLRYKEKRRTRLFAKKIRYEVRKLNAEQRPRIKGRFVKKTSLFT